MTSGGAKRTQSGKALRAIVGRLRHFLADRRGVSVLEFALVVPLLLALYFVTLEFAQGIEANKKVGRVASLVGDLVAQQQDTRKSEIDAIMKIAEAILQPYDRSQPTIIVTAIQITDDDVPQTKVVWSRELVNQAFQPGDAPGTVTTVPAALNRKGTFLIRTEALLEYEPLIAWSPEGKAALGLAAAFDSISMHETYYLRPRISSTIPCADC